MLTKVLFTVAVIIAVVFFVRLRRRAELGTPTAYPSVATSRISYNLVRWLASAVVVLMIAGAAFFMYRDWRSASEIVRVRVIDAGTGNYSEYEVYRGEIDDRSFRTIDGRRIFLADTERMETSVSRDR